MRRRSVTVLLALAMTATVAVPSRALDGARPMRAVEHAFVAMGLPITVPDKVWDRDTGRATCIWRELTGREPVRSWPTLAEIPEILATAQLPPAANMVLGLNISVTCQAAVWVRLATAPDSGLPAFADETSPEWGNVPDTTTTPQRRVVAVMPVSTGMPDSYPTRVGLHRVSWTVDRWWQSTIYADGKMYRPMFFAKGQALHGSSSDTLVKWYPASHGCVRMLHKDIDALWAGGFGRGDKVRVYGEWNG